MDKEKDKYKRITKAEMTDEGAARLAAAIVEAAVNDYRDYSFKLKKLRMRAGGNRDVLRSSHFKNGVDECLREIRSSRRFFFSRTFSLISNIDPNWLIETLEQQVEEYNPCPIKKKKGKIK